MKPAIETGLALLIGSGIAALIFGIYFILFGHNFLLILILFALTLISAGMFSPLHPKIDKKTDDVIRIICLYTGISLITYNLIANPGPILTKFIKTIKPQQKNAKRHTSPQIQKEVKAPRTAVPANSRVVAVAQPIRVPVVPPPIAVRVPAKPQEIAVPEPARPQSSPQQIVVPPPITEPPAIAAAPSTGDDREYLSGEDFVPPDPVEPPISPVTGMTDNAEYLRMIFQQANSLELQMYRRVRAGDSRWVAGYNIWHRKREERMRVMNEIVRQHVDANDRLLAIKSEWRRQKDEIDAELLRKYAPPSQKY